MTSSAGALPSSSRAAIGLWVCLAALAALRAALAFDSSMWNWGLNLLRFVEPTLGWALWLPAAAALAPPLARWGLPAARRAGAALVTGWRGPLVLAAIAFAALFLQPDRVHLVGDFLLRFGTAERALHPDKLYPQALPLDVLLHYELPRALASAAGVPVDLTARVLGAIEGGALALLAVSFARALELDGAALFAAIVIALAGGFLGLFTGYGKAVAELVLLGFGTAAAGMRAMREPRAGWALGLCLALGLFLHRSALGLLPAGAYAWWRAWRHAPAERRTRTLLPIALPVLALAIMLPRIVATMRRWDPVHLVPSEVAREGGILPAALTPLHLLDLANVLMVVSPLVLAAVWLAVAADRAEKKPQRLLVLLVTAPWWPVLLILRPPQGLFRDWDDFAPAGATLSLWAACLIGLTLQRRPRWEWLGVAAALGALAPAGQWLAHHADLDRGIARVQAFLDGPPARPETERGLTWDWLGIRAAQLGRWDLAAGALARAAETTPSPRVLTEWGLAERERGNELQAQGLFRRVTVLTPEDPNAWYRLAASSWRLADYDECLRATLQLKRLQPRDETVKHMLDDLQRVSPQHEPAR